MERLALVGRLKNDSLQRARELIRAGPAFEAKERCFRRLFILLPATEVIFVFEGHQVEWPVFGLQETARADDPLATRQSPGCDSQP